MRGVSVRLAITCIFIVLVSTSQAFAAYNLEVPTEPWDEYRLQFKKYSQHLLASYDRAFVEDFDGAIREVDKAIQLLPEEGIGFAERSRYHRILTHSLQAENDFKTAISLFDKAIEQYRPKTDKKSKKKLTRKTNTADAGRLVATLRYQRGEAYFNFEQYRKASDDFAAACQGGNSIACARIWDIKSIEKRGVHWAPISARQYYDRRRIERPSPAVVRVWVRREEFQSVQAESDSESYIQQYIELNCPTREFRLVEAFAVSNGSQHVTEKGAGSGFAKATVGSVPSKLLTVLCPSNRSDHK